MNFDEQYLKANEPDGSTARLMYSEDKEEIIPESTASRKLRKTYTLDEEEDEFGSSGDDEKKKYVESMKTNQNDNEDEYGFKSIISNMNENKNNNGNNLHSQVL